MEAKFTKGEWFVHTIDPAVIITPGGGFDITGLPNAKANAHLIAAAPDMYKILAAILKECQENPSCIDLGEQIDSLSGDMELALSKARGEQ